VLDIGISRSTSIHFGPVPRALDDDGYTSIIQRTGQRAADADLNSERVTRRFLAAQGKAERSD
jgi:hypothetical protein